MTKYFFLLILLVACCLGNNLVVKAQNSPTIPIRDTPWNGYIGSPTNANNAPLGVSGIYRDWNNWNLSVNYAPNAPTIDSIANIDAPYTYNQLIIEFYQGVSHQSILQIKADLDGVIIDSIPSQGIYLFEFPSIVDPRNTNASNQRSRIVGIEEVSKKASKKTKIKDVDFNYRLGRAPSSVMPFNVNLGNWALDSIGVSTIKNSTVPMTDTVVVAVIDAGLDYTLEAFKHNLWHNTDEINGDGIDNDHNGYIDDKYGYNFSYRLPNFWDDNGHGTHVSGIILQTIGALEASPTPTNLPPSTGIGCSFPHVPNTNPNPKDTSSVITYHKDNNVFIMPLKTQDSLGLGNLFDIVKAIDYAIDNGANIINLSIGYYGNQPVAHRLRKQIERAQDVLFVASAGNEGNNNDNEAHYPSGYDLPNVLAVGASNPNNSLALFSNYGATSVDILAPGIAIPSTIPDPNLGAFMFSINPDANDIGITSADWGERTGTSMSTAFVTGVAIAILAQDNTANVLDVKNHILATSSKFTHLQRTCVTAGRLNASGVYLTVVSTTTAPTRARMQTDSEHIQKQNVKVYPSPFTDILNIDLYTEKDSEALAQLYTLTGQLVHSEISTLNSGPSTLRYNLQAYNLTQGVYILKVTTPEQEIVSQLIKH